MVGGGVVAELDGFKMFNGAVMLGLLANKWYDDDEDDELAFIELEDELDDDDELDELDDVEYGEVFCIY